MRSPGTPSGSWLTAITSLALSVARLAGPILHVHGCVVGGWRMASGPQGLRASGPGTQPASYARQRMQPACARARPRCRPAQVGGNEQRRLEDGPAAGGSSSSSSAGVRRAAPALFHSPCSAAHAPLAGWLAAAPRATLTAQSGHAPPRQTGTGSGAAAARRCHRPSRCLPAAWGSCWPWGRGRQSAGGRGGQAAAGHSSMPPSPPASTKDAPTQPTSSMSRSFQAPGPAKRASPTDSSRFCMTAEGEGAPAAAAWWPPLVRPAPPACRPPAQVRLRAAHPPPTHPTPTSRGCQRWCARSVPPGGPTARGRRCPAGAGRWAGHGGALAVPCSSAGGR